ncbi:hypothetical protein [Methyloversatilis sp. NSM2]|uniref:hypothetical protein n=1 Tax=Methyloversatilis sp. NSM2 TaxID=3134135 RepID=UPI00311142FB
MKALLDYLDEAKTALGVETDYALAKKMKWSTAQMSNYRARRRILDDFQAARIADVLSKSPMEVIAAANVERAKDDDERAYWVKLWKDCAQKKTARKSGPSNLAPRPGLEPGTYGLTVRRRNALKAKPDKE